MDNEKKAVLRQYQLSGIGLIVFVFGLFEQDKIYMIIGVCIALFGFARAKFIQKLIDKGKED